jgi:hypothetical protein
MEVSTVKSYSDILKNSSVPEKKIPISSATKIVPSSTTKIVSSSPSEKILTPSTEKKVLPPSSEKVLPSSEKVLTTPSEKTLPSSSEKVSPDANGWVVVGEKEKRTKEMRLQQKLEKAKNDLERLERIKAKMDTNIVPEDN